MYDRYRMYCHNLGVHNLGVDPKSTELPERAGRPKLTRRPDGGASGDRQPRLIKVTDLTDEHSQEFTDLLELGLDSIADVFSARKLALNGEGDVVDLGPDLASGMAATQVLLQLVTRGRPPVLPPGRRPRTYEEMLPDFRKRVKESNKAIDQGKRNTAGLEEFEKDAA
jgi:hypothetical protein